MKNLNGLILFAEVKEALQNLKNEIAKRSERCYIYLVFSELTLKRPKFKIKPNYPFFFCDAELSTAWRTLSLVNMQKLMSSALQRAVPL